MGYNCCNVADPMEVQPLMPQPSTPQAVGSTPVKKIRRQTIQVVVPPQMRLFVEPATPLPKPPARPGRADFVDHDPFQIQVGNQRLDTYLEAAKVTWVFAFRKFLRRQDWSEFETSYKAGGRPPYAPAAMLALVLYGTLQGRGSLRELERLARVDLACMWGTGGILPDHSVIGRFLFRHKELLPQEFFETLTRDVVRETGGQCSDLSGDGTVVQAAATRYRLLSAEAAKLVAAEARHEAVESPQNADLQARATQSEAVAQVAQERAAARKANGGNATGAVVSPSEPDAVLQPLKDKSMAPSYKPSALANDQRVVVAHSVHASSEIQVLPGMIDQAERVGNGKVERLKLDAGYFAEDVLKLACEKDIQVLCPEGKATSDISFEKVGKTKFAKNRFRYDEVSNTYTCPAGETLEPCRERSATAKYPGYVEYRTTACATCPLRERCTDSPQGRAVSRYRGDELREAQRIVMEHPKAREAYRARKAEIEPVFADLKGVQSLRRFRRRGLAKVQLEFALHVMAHNVRRMLILRGTAQGLSSANFAALIAGLRLALVEWSREPFGPEWDSATAEAPIAA